LDRRAARRYPRQGFRPRADGRTKHLAGKEVSSREGTPGRRRARPGRCPAVGASLVHRRAQVSGPAPRSASHVGACGGTVEDAASQRDGGWTDAREPGAAAAAEGRASRPGPAEPPAARDRAAPTRSHRGARGRGAGGAARPRRDRPPPARRAPTPRSPTGRGAGGSVARAACPEKAPAQGIPPLLSSADRR
jgi:hypothetical protein